MKFELFLTIIYLFGWKCGESNAAIGNFQMKNFLLLYGVANVAKDEMATLVNLVASPVIANASSDPKADMFDSKTVILNYSIANIAEPENFVKIPSKGNTKDYFKNLLQRYNDTNKNVKKFSLKKLLIFLRKCPQFSGISVITNMKPDDGDVLPEILQVIKNRSLEVVVSAFDSTTIKSQYVGYRYFHPIDLVPKEYNQINKIKYDLDQESFVKRILNEFVFLRGKTDPIDTNIVMIFDWFSMVQLLIRSDLQNTLNLFAEELYNNKLVYSYQGRRARIKTLYIVSSNMEQSEMPVEEIDLSKSHDFEYFDKIVSNLANTNDTSRFSIKSLIKGLNLSSPNGIVFLFTGTQPQHTDLLPAALKIMEDKKIMVEVAYVKSKKYSQPDIEYQQINEASYKIRPSPT